MIENLGKGALPDKPDDRDYQAPLGAVNVDWTTEFRLPEPPQEDQANSDSCVAQAWSYYHWQLHGKGYSRRDLFCRIALDYGAYVRDGGKEIVNNGQATRDEVSDPNPQTAQNMRSTAGTSLEFRGDDKELNYFVLPQQDINGVAWGIKTYKGVVFGLNGDNVGWANLKYPKPPSLGVNVWGHALYAMGYHTCTDGQKCIIAKSSWKEVNEHHVRENYFITGNTFNAWTLIPKEQQMYKTKKVKFNGALGVMVITPNMVNITLAEDEPEWRSYSKSDSYAVHSVNSDGSTDSSVDLEINI